MRAIVCTKYGPPDVLQLREIAKPAPKDNEVLIKVHAATVTAGDCELRRFQIPVLFWLPLRLLIGIRAPRNLVLGQELAGKIESVGQNVTRFAPGDQVFGVTGFGFGAHADYACISTKVALATKPATMTYAEAAAVPVGGLNALFALRRGNIRNGQKVLIYGASGSIGTFAVQLASHFGAHVTGVCGPANVEMVKSLGADTVIDYTKEDFTQNGETYDIILDAVGKSPFPRSLDSLEEGGYYLLANPRLSQQVRGLWISLTTGKKILSRPADQKTEDLLFLIELIEMGEIRTAIDRCYPLEQTAEAHRYVDKGHKKGNVIITVERESEGTNDMKPIV